jgi:glycosyltransferase involved in cell wall biosynthesis
MLAFVAAGAWECLRLTRRNRPDALHVHFAVPAGAVAWIVWRLSGVPYVLTAHLGDVPGGVPEKTDRWFGWILPLTPPIWRRARRVVAVSAFTRNLALLHYPVEIGIIPNGVDLQKIRPSELAPHDPVRLVFAGRFMTQKNPLRVVEILRQLADLPWECAMLGDGPLLPDVRRLVARSGLGGRIALPGWVTPERALQELSKSDILLMPSLAEGLPVAGVHALACGLALVVSDIGGFTDLVEDGANGFLVAVDDKRAFAAALRRLIHDRELLLQFRRKSLEKARDFEMSHVADRYEAMLREVCDGD